MKSPKTKQDLIETAVRQIELDVHCGDVEAIEELLKFCPVENVIAYLPEVDWKPFTHLVAEDYLQKEEPSISTKNAITNLITQFPNDADLGKEIRKRWQNK